MTEKELLAGNLTLARCGRCGGRGVYRQAVLAYDGDDLQEVEQKTACGCRERPVELWQRANLPPGRFDGLTLANLDWTRLEPPKVATTIQDYADHLEAWLVEGMGLVLYGYVGTGKTHVAIGLIKLACGLGIEARFLTMGELLEGIKATYDRERGLRHRRGEARTRDEAGLLGELAALPLLALDDLGTENPTPWARDCLYRLINRRYLARRPTIVTTNLGPDRMVEQVGDQTLSRLWGASLVIEFRGSDYRTRAKQTTLRQLRSQNVRLLTPASSQNR